MGKPLKIIMTGEDIEHIFSICKYIIDMDDNINMSRIFTSSIDYKDIENEYYYFLDINEINMSYKNNSLLCTYTNNDITTGVTIDDLYNNDIIPINVWHFNNISNNILFGSESYEILIICIDTKYHRMLNNLEMTEIKYMYDRLCSDNKINYMYFLDEDYENIYKILLDYINGDDEKRKELINENQ